MARKPNESSKIAKRKKEDPDKKQTKTVNRIQFNDRSDKGFSPTTRTDLLKIIRIDRDNGEAVQKSYITQKVLDLQHYHSVKPSKLVCVRTDKVDQRKGEGWKVVADPLEYNKLGAKLFTSDLVLMERK